MQQISVAIHFLFLVYVCVWGGDDNALVQLWNSLILLKFWAMNYYLQASWQPSLSAEPSRPYLGILTILSLVVFVFIHSVDFSSSLCFYDSVYIFHTFSEIKVCNSPLSVVVQFFQTFGVYRSAHTYLICCMYVHTEKDYANI